MRNHSRTPFIEGAITSIGSITSLLVHTVFFAVAFLSALFGLIDWQLMLLVLTTVVSLEAIYMAIFVQIAVNRNTEQLRSVEEDIDEIQEDVEELSEDVEDIQEDIEEISDDIEEIQEDVEELNEEEEAAAAADAAAAARTKAAKSEEDMLAQLTKDVERVLRDLEALKKGK